MKKILMLIIIIISCVTNCSYYDNNCIVINKSYDYGLIECVDVNGNIWAFNSNNSHIEEGDFLKIRMNTHGTNDIVDDSIVKILY